MGTNLDGIIKLSTGGITMSLVVLLHCSLYTSIRSFGISPLILPGERLDGGEPHPGRVETPYVGLRIRFTISERRERRIVLPGFSRGSLFFSV
jgi:hypothetical protein